jgi:predicted phage tail protein
MPLPELGRRLQNQAPQGRLSKRKICLKNISNARDAINTLAKRVKNMRIRLAKKHTQISITKLRDRKQVLSQPIHKSDIIQGEAVIYLDDAGTKHLTLLVIPKSHILLV